MMWLPTFENTLLLHKKVAAASGGSPEMRTHALVESALARAHAGFGGEELYPAIEQKAAAICCGLIQNHAFVDGNKRIGVTVLLLILSQNHVALRYPQADLIELGMSVAKGEWDVPQVVDWIAAHRG